MGGIIPYLLFFLAGLGFGYAAPVKWRWLPLLFPVVLGGFALFKYGPDASVIVRLIVAIVITILGIILGSAIDARAGAREGRPHYA